MAEPIRLQKFFTDCGILSRRAAEAEIAAGRVRVNGEIAHVGDKIDPDTDRVEYKGRLIRQRPKQTHTYLMLHKPRGYVTTLSDEKGRKTVADLIPPSVGRVYPIGRLDMDSEGLLLLTDDGELTNRLTHPRHEIPKIYHVTLGSVPSKQSLAALEAPMELDGYRLQPIGVKQLSPDTLKLTLFEGRNRQIRRMCEAVGLKVVRLHRVAIGDLKIGTLPAGHCRALTPDEVAYLYGKKDKL